MMTLQPSSQSCRPQTSPCSCCCVPPAPDLSHRRPPSLPPLATLRRKPAQPGRDVSCECREMCELPPIRGRWDRSGAQELPAADALCAVADDKLPLHHKHRLIRLRQLGNGPHPGAAFNQTRFPCKSTPIDALGRAYREITRVGYCAGVLRHL